MADLTITASAVAPSTNAVVARGTAGVAINAGQLVYMDASDSNKLKLAAHTSAITAAVVGIAVNNAAANQPVNYVTAGDVTLNAVLTAATVYVLGSAAGSVSPSDDLHSSTNARFGTVLGISTSTTNLRVTITQSGVLNP
jgi:hypothetical protein